MRRPTRTRRLSIAAIVSLMAFVVVSGASVRSFWIYNGWGFGRFRYLDLQRGRVVYERFSGGSFETMADHSRFLSNPATPLDALSTFKFAVLDQTLFGGIRVFVIWTPLWPILLLLLIAPLRWLVARPANAPAFPVLTKQP